MYFDRTFSGVQNTAPLKEICAYARGKGLKVMVHCAHSPAPMKEIVSILSPGDILTYPYHGAENTCEEENFGALRLAREKSVIIDSGFAGHVHTEFGVMKRALQAGFLPDTLSTDVTRFSAYTRGGRYGMTLCMNIAIACGMEEADVFRAVTSVPARALAREDSLGYLKPGRWADIAVFSEDGEGFFLEDGAGNRIESKKGYRCLLTVADGQIVYRD